MRSRLDLSSELKSATSQILAAVNNYPQQLSQLSHFIQALKEHKHIYFLDHANLGPANGSLNIKIIKYCNWTKIIHFSSIAQKGEGKKVDHMSRATLNQPFLIYYLKRKEIRFSRTSKPPATAFWATRPLVTSAWHFAVIPLQWRFSLHSPEYGPRWTYL